MHWPTSPADIRAKRRSQVKITGVYVWYSPTVQAAVRNAFPKSTKIALKIGSSEDVVLRNAEARGEDSWRTTDPDYGFEPYAYAGVADWRLYRYTTHLNGLALLDREEELQLRHSSMATQTWATVYHHLTGSRRAPRPQELYFTTIDRSLLEDFPILHPIDHDLFIQTVERLLASS